MKASSLTSRLKGCLAVRDWAWWELPPRLRWYVAIQPAAAIAAIGATAAHTNWRLHDLVVFFVLMCCGTVSIASTPRILYSYPGVTRDFTTIWILPTAILLPPVYAGILPIVIVATLHLYVHRGILYRQVFTASTIIVCNVGASLAFRQFPSSFAGGSVGSGFHAFTWCLAVATCEILGCRAQHYLIVGAVKLSNPAIKVLTGEFDRDALQALFVEIDLGVLITLAVAISPALVVIALPSVLLVRRFLVFPILEAQSRTDAKTGLLNVSTWESEAEAELSRAIRSRSPLALALVDIDHFKGVNDTYGHLVGDKVLKAVAESLTSHLRDYDRAGRFGGEEFVLLLAQKTTKEDACKVAERLRTTVADLAIPIDDRPDAEVVRVTISIGVTAIAEDEKCELTDLLAAADSALYHAKQSGRNCVAVAAPQPNMGLDSLGTAAPDATNGVSNGRRVTVLNTHDVALVQADPTAVSLCLGPLLSVLARALHEFIVR
jgi:diguanylate cyclase (GGDEF)-like protein